jgi:hypothetical protein
MIICNDIYQFFVAKLRPAGVSSPANNTSQDFWNMPFLDLVDFPQYWVPMGPISKKMLIIFGTKSDRVVVPLAAAAAVVPVAAVAALASCALSSSSSWLQGVCSWGVLSMILALPRHKSNDRVR